MKLKVRGKKKLQGTIKISGSKNSAVAIIAAAILSDEEVIIRNVPEIDDVLIQIKILEEQGYNTYFKDNVFKLRPLKKMSTNFLSENISKLRGSYYFMGAVLGKMKKIKIKHIGGCDLGDRPINYHLDALKELNVKIKEKNDYFYLKTKSLKASTIKLPFPSVGATINAMIASTKAKGETIIENAALEPEVSDVGNFLISMGAKIEGLSTKTIKITGVDYLHYTDYYISSDRIEAGTYLILGTMATGKGITLENVQPYHLKSLIDVLEQAGANISKGEQSITIKGNNELTPFDIETGTYPNFPTDLGPIISVLMTQIEGTSSLKETIFKNRFSHVEELKKALATISVSGNTIYIDGKTKLKSTVLTAYDLRGAAAMLLCACIASGTTIIDNIEILFRGYEKPIEKLSSLGLSLSLIND